MRSSPDVGNICRTGLPKFLVFFSSAVPLAITTVISFDGRAWRALVAGYEPPRITVDGVSVSNLKVDWINAKEQASAGNARVINAIFNGVDLNVITSKFEALKMAEDESVSEYNERVLEISNESLLLGE
ncbi:gag-pol polyprotein [Cucumis melo var. makuwa]|uniref:Gag-pol polyprotein n=1 Tax=Cucumis melo var. makuwa TaxID=1194695 RepID=A0A5A7SSJ9_CUCMM|nr:gag-pol polyprotein [Cucumis melo var. makuwa]TYK02898.1 gag-pol polyprotein [Cucumis melo var. makuwa]